jgi:predicted membrane protein DUF2231
MSSGTATATASHRPRPRAELVLGVLGILTFVLIPIHINTIYSGLPAHPLFLHVPVILIPLVGIAALALAVRPVWFERHGVWITGLAVIALASVNLTMGAGEELRRDLGGDDAGLIARHADAAGQLRIVFIAFTAVLIIAIAAHRASRRWEGPLAFINGILRPLATNAGRIVLRVAIALLAIGSLYTVFHTGDLGSKAVWQGRLGHHGGFSGGFRPGGGGPRTFPGGQLPPSGG